MTAFETMPFPEDPTLAAYAAALNETGHWAAIYDAQWRVAYCTDEYQRSLGPISEISGRTRGKHIFGPECAALANVVMFGDGAAAFRDQFRDFGRYILFDTSGGREELRIVVDPSLLDLVGEIEPVEMPHAFRPIDYTAKRFGLSGRFTPMFMRLRDSTGAFVGVVWLSKPLPGMSKLAFATELADLDHLDRMALVTNPDRRPAAVLMADIEGSSSLARRLSTAQYFAFGRRFVRAADQCVVDHGGIVGRHVGDGVVAFFLAETAGSESAAARSCIETARALRTVITDVAERSGLDADAVSLRFGLHWGATLYVGRISTVGRSEVTALGDEVNETARIEACAAGGRTLASKGLIERLNNTDARALTIDPNHANYTVLGQLDTATDKALRDAPHIAVCDV